MSTAQSQPHTSTGGVAPQAGGPVRLNLGCGHNKMPGWINVDSVKAFEPDLEHDISQPLPYPDESVDEIIADGLLEHFDKYARFAVFYEWVRVLKTGGVIHVGVPNFQKILRRYFKFRFYDFVDTIFGENMLESQVYIGHYGNHKWAYSPASLKDFVSQFGIEPGDIEKLGLNIRLTCKKVRHVDRAEIDAMEIYASANAHGGGKAAMTVAEAREKMAVFHQV